MSYYVFADNSNIWIEGKYASAVKKGWAPNAEFAHENHIIDNQWRFDFGKLLNFSVNGKTDQIKDAYIFGSKPTDTDTLWGSMKKAGYRVVPVRRNASNKEKKVDTGIGAKIDKVLYRESEPEDVFVLILGDSDYMPNIENILEEGRKVKVVFWNNASGDLTKAANEYVDLTPHIDEIAY